MGWWLWVLIGFGLLACEMLTPGGFFFLFFGAGAIAVGLILALGVDLSLAVQWLLFSLLSLAALVPLRGRLVRWMTTEGGAPVVDALVGQIAVVLDDLPPGEVGKAELRGTAWNARNAGTAVLRKGQRGRVIHVDGLMLSLQAE
jgi:membrane protein implicated in regulation of membrane protease activity